MKFDVPGLLISLDDIQFHMTFAAVNIGTTGAVFYWREIRTRIPQEDTKQILWEFIAKIFEMGIALSNRQENAT